MQPIPVMTRRVAAAICAALLFLSGAACAAAYGQYDIRQLLSPAPEGGKGGSLRMVYLDRMLQDIGQHAANYPPRFDSAPDQQRAQRDAGLLMGMLNAAFGAGNNQVPPELLLRMGLLGAYGHNLDVPDAAAFAQAHFSRLLAGRPDDPWGNYHYGQFLASSGRGKDAMPYLGKARDKGVVPALYAMGMVHLTMGDKPKALALLAEYQKAEPIDQNVGKLMRGIREGKVGVERGGGSQP